MVDGQTARKGASVFLAAFAFCSLVGLAVMAAGHAGLARAGLLAPPPYVATWCIDQKIDFLARADLEPVEIAAIGSSAAWRNLDMTVFEAAFGKTALNAAPCYLKVDQTAYMAEFLLPRMPELETLVAVFIPRDFEGCRVGDTAFFDAALADGIFDRRVPAWAPYITGFRPMHLMTYAFQKWRGSGGFGFAVHEDGRGSAAFAEPFGWWPDLAISEACYSDLARLEAVTRNNGVRLVVALAPNDPAWTAEWDPQGSILETWRARIRASLSDDVLIVDGRKLGFTSEQFADPMHLLHPHEADFSRLIAREIRREATNGGCVPGDPDGEC